MFPFGELVGGITSGLFNLAGGALNNAFDTEQDNVNYERQKEFAQNSIQWKAQDAKKAGFHPLAALGSNSMSYTPSASTSAGIGDALMNTGQVLGRGVANAMSIERKQQRQFNDYRLRQEKAKTEMMEKSLLKMGQVPEPTQAMATPVKNSQAPIAYTKKKAKGSNAVHAEKPAIQLLKHGNGYEIVPSQEYADSADGMIGAQMQATLSKHTNPEYWYDATIKLLPPPPKGKKWALTRKFGTGWNWEPVNLNIYGKGMFLYTRDKPKRPKSRKIGMTMPDGSYRVF